MKLNIFSKKPKITKDCFLILQYHEYDKLNKFNYNTKQLKQILKYYKQKTSGNKSILIKRTFLFLYGSYYSIIIQRNIRGYWVRNFFTLSGPALNDYSLCANDTDFLSLDKLSNLKKKDFFSFKDIDGFIYGFEFKSIYNLFLKNNKIPHNPYNRKIIPKSVIKNIHTKLRLSHLINISLDINLEKIIDAQTDLLKLRTINIFQKIDELGNYTNVNWFYDLTKFGLIKFIKELWEIWSYRAQLTPEIRGKIITGTFLFSKYKKEITMNKPYKFLQKKILTIIEKFVTLGIDKQHKSLGSFYVLGALTLVNKNAAAALPWLYESMRYN